MKDQSAIEWLSKQNLLGRTILEYHEAGHNPRVGKIRSPGKVHVTKTLDEGTNFSGVTIQWTDHEACGGLQRSVLFELALWEFELLGPAFFIRRRDTKNEDDAPAFDPPDVNSNVYTIVAQ